MEKACNECGLQVEYDTEDNEVDCPNCGHIILIF